MRVCDDGIPDRRSPDPRAPRWRMNHRRESRRASCRGRVEGDSCQVAAMYGVCRWYVGPHVESHRRNRRTRPSVATRTRHGRATCIGAHANVIGR